MKSARFFFVIALLLFASFGAWDLLSHTPTLKPQPSAPIVAVEEPTSTPPTPALTPTEGQLPFIEVVDSCGPYYQGDCVNMRSGPGEEFPVVSRLRTGIVLQVATTVEAEGRTWYRIEQEKAIRYPERVTSDWYVAADLVRLFYDDGEHWLAADGQATTTQHIVVNAKEQMLYAYDGDTLFMQTPISTGIEFTPTPRGSFIVYGMKPSRHMQGPLPGLTDEYDLPGVPWNLYFTEDGAVIHGAYWHDHFGKPWSHGCINLPLAQAKKLYLWAQLGATVTVEY